MGAAIWTAVVAAAKGGGADGDGGGQGLWICCRI